MSFSAASISVIVLGTGLILGYDGCEVTRCALTVGGLVAFYGYVFRLFAPVSIAIDLQSRLQRVGASIRRILEITSGDPPIAVRESMTPLRGDTRPELEFRSVWFCYDESRPVLRDMNFRIEAGRNRSSCGPERFWQEHQLPSGDSIVRAKRGLDSSGRAGHSSGRPAEPAQNRDLDSTGSGSF